MLARILPPHTQTQHTFKRVINGTSSQSTVYDMVGFPLTEQLMQGKNGLLLAYGITNSGKTYTMTGEPDAPGVLPRCLDVVFNSIAEVQAPKFVSFVLICICCVKHVVFLLQLVLIPFFILFLISLLRHLSLSLSLSLKVFRPDGTNGFNIFSESDARVEQSRNRGKKLSPRMRYVTDHMTVT